MYWQLVRYNEFIATLCMTDPVINCWLQTKQLLILSLHGLIDYDHYYNLLLGKQLSSQGLNMMAYFCLVI